MPKCRAARVQLIWICTRLTFSDQIITIFDHHSKRANIYNFFFSLCLFINLHWWWHYFPWVVDSIRSNCFVCTTHNCYANFELRTYASIPLYCVHCVLFVAVLKAFIERYSHASKLGEWNKTGKRDENE